jgi:ElaB/YqjD/DUF883 family membrane-anchored ribosome-binding protein
MTNNTITSTRETLIKDADHLKQEAGQIIEDVKMHASTHIDAVKNKVSDTFDLARSFVKEHPLKLMAGSLLIGFLVGTFRRK